MNKLIIALSSILIPSLLCSCIPEETKSIADGKYCVECGADATHLAGTGWVKSLNGPGLLYLCDDCYEKMYHENSDRVVNIQPDPSGIGG